jgi:hypothetical protein
MKVRTFIVYATGNESDEERRHHFVETPEDFSETDVHVLCRLVYGPLGGVLVAEGVPFRCAHTGLRWSHPLHEIRTSDIVRVEDGRAFWISQRTAEPLIVEKIARAAWPRWLHEFKLTPTHQQEEQRLRAIAERCGLNADALVEP